jgi:hypothetical protein
MTAPFLVEFVFLIAPLVLSVSISGKWETLGVGQPCQLFQCQFAEEYYHDCKLASGATPA